MPWGAAAAVAGSVISGSMASSSSKKAASAARQQAADQQAKLDALNTELKYEYQPYSRQGAQASEKLGYLLGTADKEGKQEYQLEDFINKARSDLESKGVKARRIEGMATTYGQRWYKDYVNAGKDNAATQKQFGLRQLVDRPIDTSDGEYGNLLKSFTNEDFVKDPGYEFRLAEGEKGINRAASARGGYDSGATLKALQKYGQDYASSEFGSAYSRDAANKARIYDFLSGSANRGLSATSARGGVSSGLLGAGAQLGQNATNMANQYQMAGAAGVNEAIQSGIGNLLYSQRTQPANTAIVSSSGGGASPGVNLGGYTGSIPWYQS